MVAEENESSIQEFHFFKGISWLMVSVGVDRQAHGILKLYPLGIITPVSLELVWVDGWAVRCLIG